MTTGAFAEEEKLLERSALRALRVYGEARLAWRRAAGNERLEAKTKEAHEKALATLNHCAERLVEHDREVGT